MQSSTRQSFLAKAEDRLAGVRGSLLLFAQGRLSAADLIQASRRLDKLGADAEQNGLADTAGLAADCSSAIELVAATDHNDAQVTPALDLISRLEAEILQIQLSSGDFLSDVSELVEASFEHFKGISAAADSVVNQEPADEDFEVDDETLEIFRSEAEGLLANISANLNILSRTPEDNNALWEIRRNAHTFKGAAGIIGLREASALAHRIEDLLDKMVESGRGADARVIDLLSASTQMLDDMTAGKHVNDDGEIAAKLYSDFANLLASAPPSGVEPVEDPDAPPARSGKTISTRTPFGYLHQRDQDRFWGAYSFLRRPMA